MNDWPRGFYAVVSVDVGASLEHAASLADALIAGGARVVQLRMKDAATRQILAAAARLREITASAGVALVINDRVDIARAVGADGVHLGQDDLPLEAARVAAGQAASDDANPRLVIGISTHTAAQVRAAVTGGADYVGFGPVFATRTKAAPDPAKGLPALAHAVALAHPVPLVAIGGITLDNVAEVVASGARAVCAISAVNDAAEITRAAAGMAAAFARAERR